MHPNADEASDIVIEEGVGVVTTGAGNPGKYMDKWKKAGLKVFPIVPSVAFARRMEKYGADGVITEGTESGRHVGELTTMALFLVVSAVQIPVVAAGGIASGPQMLAALPGAVGVQIVPRYLYLKNVLSILIIKCIIKPRIRHHSNWKNCGNSCANFEKQNGA